MRAPIKLNRAFWPEFLTNRLPSADDPRVLLNENIDETTFTRAVSTFKFGEKLKSTKKDRFPLTIRALCELERTAPPVVLDVGASDGITSLDVMQSLAFTRYYATDLNTEARCRLSSGKGYFYDPTGKALLIVSDRFVVYSEIKGAIPPFGYLVRRMLKRTPVMDDAARISLINPSIRKKLGANVFFQRHDIRKPWTVEKVDLVLAANILNRCYFPDSEITLAIQNFRAALKDGGYVAIIDNRDVEKSSIFRILGGHCSIVSRINGGTEIESLAEQALTA